MESGFPDRARAVDPDLLGSFPQFTAPERTPVTTTAKTADTRGLAGQTVGDTKICSVNQTQLIYRGYEIADLAANATFEEVSYLLLVGHKPSAGELAAFKA